MTRDVWPIEKYQKSEAQLRIISIIYGYTFPLACSRSSRLFNASLLTTLLYSARFPRNNCPLRLEWHSNRHPRLHLANIAHCIAFHPIPFRVFFHFVSLTAFPNVSICSGVLADEPRSFNSRKLSESTPASSRSQWLRQILGCM